MVCFKIPLHMDAYKERCAEREVFEGIGKGNQLVTWT